eukprot:g13893.t1
MATPKRLVIKKQNNSIGNAEDALFTPLTRKNIKLTRRLEEQAARATEPNEYSSIADVYKSSKFFNGYCACVIATVCFNVLFTWGSLSSWGKNKPVDIFAFHMIQPAGGKGQYTCAAIDIAVTSLIVAIMNTLGTFDKTDNVDLGKIGTLDPAFLSQGVWRYAPRGPNWVRLILNALIFEIIFGGIGVVVLAILWSLNVGGEEMEMNAWSYIIAKSLWAGIEAALVFTTSYVVALSRGDRSRAESTRLLVAEKKIQATKFLNTIQSILGFIVVGFTFYTWYFAFGGVESGIIIGMWISGSASILLGIWGNCTATYDMTRARQSHLFYCILQFCFLVCTIVASGFCLVYTEQGHEIITNHWNEIKTAILLPFTSEYDLKQTLSSNLEYLAAFGFTLAFFMLIGILHFAQRLGPGQDIILALQAMNMVLMILGIVALCLIGDIGLITAFSSPDGSFVLVVLFILECGFVLLSVTLGVAVAGKREPKLLTSYILCLFALLTPTAVFSVFCFVRADNAHSWVFSKWEIIQQVLPAEASMWTNCSPNQVTKCMSGLAVTGNANFQAIGWIAAATVFIALVQIFFAFKVRMWKISISDFHILREASYSADGSHESFDNMLQSPYGGDEEQKSSRSSSRASNGYGSSNRGGKGTGTGSLSFTEQNIDVVIGEDTPLSKRSFDYGATTDESNQRLTTTPVSNLGDGDDSSNHNSLPRLYQKSYEYIQGFSCAGCLGKAAPSAMLQNLREWSSRNPLFSKFVTLIIVCIFAAGVFAGASFLHASTTCGLIAQNPYQTTHIFKRSMPYGCYDDFMGTMTKLNANHSCDAGTQKYPNLFKIKVKHEFPYGYVNVVSYNGTRSEGKDGNEIRATLVYSSVKEYFTEKWGNPMVDSSYDFDSGTLTINVLPSDAVLEKFFGSYIHCPAAALTIELPTPIFIDAFGAKLTLLEVCADTKNAGADALPLGCTDLEVTTTDAQVTMDSGINIALSQLTSNNTQAFITSLVDQYPFRKVTVGSSGAGNIVGNSLFTMGTITFKSENGHITVTNSFGDGVSLETTLQPIQILDLGGVSLDLLDPLKPGFAYDYINIKSVNGDVFFGNLVACSTMTIGTEYGNLVGATVEILGNLDLSSTVGTIYLNGVNSLANIKVSTDSGDIKGSAVVSNFVTVTSNSGNLNIIELFLGIALKELAPPNQGAPGINTKLTSGDITLEGLQGLMNPSDASNLNVNLQTGGAGNVKLIINGNGFLGEYDISSLNGKEGVLIEGETLPDGVWSMRGCVPIPKGGTNGGVPPKSCPNGGKISISTLYGNAEMIVQAGA